MLTGPLQAYIDADDVGLGKTISILAQAILFAEHIDELLIAWKARYQKLLNKALVMWQKRHGKSPEDETLLHQSISLADLDDLGPKPKHRPFLVVVPPSAINSWIRDATRFFTSAKDGNSIMHFKPNRRIVEDDGTTPDDEGNNASENDGLDEDDALDENDDLDEGDDLDEDDGEGDSDYVKLQITRSKLNIDADMFGFAVADEAHRLKNPFSKQSGAVGKLLCPVVMCTATPFINTVRDLSGLLEIVWSHIKQRFPHNFNAPTNQDFVKNYNTFSTKYGCNVL
ncbi:hypothetical protein KC318_g84 [Hortaea werneckii]|nr:hypothetical protein KC334_g75 [Hortaea werneckii]KAI7028070.1 hypothetical protein KC355_g83 [Hortaea werneckii]KAI7199257.1 hypothetical protein KC324_g3351 [Hortaea werneckii]KAI7595292.1 hypothetical protein KC316_g632 [Hortaea werneckii]KAI7676726.1 hypothetical protein KC318_g84 [Hortaea werneckii]